MVAAAREGERDVARGRRHTIARDWLQEVQGDFQGCEYMPNGITDNRLAPYSGRSRNRFEKSSHVVGHYQSTTRR